MRAMLVIGWLAVGCSGNDAAGGRPETLEADGSETDSTEELDDGTHTETFAELEVDAASEPDVTAPVCHADFPCGHFGESSHCVGTEIAQMVTVGCEAVCPLPCDGWTCRVGAPGPCPDGEACIELEPYQAFCGRPGDTCGGDAHSACDADAN